MEDSIRRITDHAVKVLEGRTPALVYPAGAVPAKPSASTAKPPIESGSRAFGVFQRPQARRGEPLPLWQPDGSDSARLLDVGRADLDCEKLRERAG